MRRDLGLWFGPLAAGVLLAGVAGLPLLVPGYDPVRQTVSEIGEVGSPAQAPFSAMLAVVGVCLLVFAVAVRALAAAEGLPRWPVYLMGFMAAPVIGIGVFAFPHPLHNVFGLSELVAYPAPLLLALAWRGRPGLGGVTAMSAAMGVLVLASLGLNLTAIARDGWVWAQVQPVYGVVQRSLFASWFLWAALLGLALARRPPG